MPTVFQTSWSFHQSSPQFSLLIGFHHSQSSEAQTSWSLPVLCRAGWLHTSCKLHCSLHCQQPSKSGLQNRPLLLACFGAYWSAAKQASGEMESTRNCSRLEFMIRFRRNFTQAALHCTLLDTSQGTSCCPKSKPGAPNTTFQVWDLNFGILSPATFLHCRLGTILCGSSSPSFYTHSGKHFSMTKTKKSGLKIPRTEI